MKVCVCLVFHRHEGVEAQRRSHIGFGARVKGRTADCIDKKRQAHKESKKSEVMCQIWQKKKRGTKTQNFELTKSLDSRKSDGS